MESTGFGSKLTTPLSIDAGSPVPPLLLEPNSAVRVRTALGAFFLAPLAILMLSTSLNSMLYWAAKGQPLSSTEGVVGVVFSSLLFLTIGITVTRTSVGIGVTAGWAAVLSVATGVLNMFTGSPQPIGLVGEVELATYLFQLTGPSSWSGLPLLIFVISSCATLATWMARAQRRLEIRPLTSSSLYMDPNLLHGDADWFAAPGTLLSPARARVHLFVLIADLALGVAVWVFTLALAPTDISAVAIYGSLALSFHSVAPLPMIGLLITFALLTLSAGWSTLGNLVTSLLLLVLPGLLLVPSITSLAGTVATPGDPLATSAALASPVIAACGLVSLSLTSGIHWVRTAPQASD